jgi:hypothetical protein
MLKETKILFLLLLALLIVFTAFTVEETIHQNDFDIIISE